MNNFQIIILALALLFNSWATYLNAGIVLLKESAIRKVYYTGNMFFFQFVMAGVGIWFGCKAGILEVRVNMMISLSILLIFGLKVLLTSIRTQGEERESDFTENKAIMFASLAEGITPLFIGVAIGLLSLHPYLQWVLTGIFLLIGILSGLIVANSMGLASLKLRLGPIGGLLFLAAAFKLIISMTGY